MGAAEGWDTYRAGSGHITPEPSRWRLPGRPPSRFAERFTTSGVVAAIVTLVGILGLLNTLTTSVLERRTGVRVAAVFWIEGLALAGLAWALAVLLGLPVVGFIA